MTTVAYAIGAPPAAEDRGGDCRARDLDQDRNVHGPHRFAATTNCQIDNGMIRLTVGATGVAPSFTVEAMTGLRPFGDVYVDTYADVYPGSYTAAGWTDEGVVTVDSTLLTALLTAVHIVRVNPEAITIRLVSPVMADAFVTLERGERMLHIQHGDTRARPLVSTNRRVRWTGSGLTGSTATAGRVVETAPLTDGFTRFVSGPLSATLNAGAFSVNAAGVSSAAFGVGVATPDRLDTVADMVAQLGDATRSRLVVT